MTGKRSEFIIGLAGTKRSGKTTAARHLIALAEQQGLVPIRLGFADPIKAEVAKIFGTYKEEDKAVLRPVYQAVGQSMKELHGKDIWIKRLLEAWNHYRNHGYNMLIIDDVRFPFEGEWVRNLGGQVWKIIRDTGLKDDHVSETSVKSVKADHSILNSMSEQDFLVKVTNTWSQM